MGKEWYRLGSAEDRAAMHPGRFVIAELEQRRNLGPEFMALLLFELEPPPHRGPSGERMWVAIEAREASGDGRSVSYRGRLLSHPAVLTCIKHGDPVPFEPRHVADYELMEVPRPRSGSADASVVDPYGQAGDPKRPS